jgi:Fur family transcriptional regulator, zinc uptake regulator
MVPVSHSLVNETSIAEPGASLASGRGLSDIRHMTAAHLACAPTTLQDSLREAEALCEARGGRLTPLRRKVLTLLLESHGPAKAYDLLGHLGEDGAAKPPSVYRSLDFLLEMGLAHKIESLNAFVACGHWGHGHAAVFLICDQCGSASELHAERSLSTLTAEVDAANFRMRSAVMEVRGLCANCA